MIRDISPEQPLDNLHEFLAWAVQEEEGKYTNLIEAFLWFCGSVERIKPTFFL
jgi:hypothetical protein